MIAFVPSTLIALLSLSTLGLTSGVIPKQRLSCSAIPDSVFPPLDYNKVQISSGFSGDALKKATDLCVTPFNGLNLKDITREELTNLNNFFRAAEDAEVHNFVPLLAKLKGEAKVELQRGITKNKILKLVCDIQVAKIKTAQGNTQHDDIAAETKKLNHNLALEAAAQGLPSKSFL